jgi:hypothetical protein
MRFDAIIVKNRKIFDAIMSTESTVLIYSRLFLFLFIFRRKQLIDQLMTSLRKDYVLINVAITSSAAKKNQYPK